MVARLFSWLLVRYAGSPGRAALYLAVVSALRRRLRRREVVVTERLRPGEALVVEHLRISHRRQARQLKQQARAARAAERAARRAGRRVTGRRSGAS